MIGLRPGRRHRAVAGAGRQHSRYGDRDHRGQAERMPCRECRSVSGKAPKHVTVLSDLDSSFRVRARGYPVGVESV